VPRNNIKQLALGCIRYEAAAKSFSAANCQPSGTFPEAATRDDVQAWGYTKKEESALYNSVVASGTA